MNLTIRIIDTSFHSSSSQILHVWTILQEKARKRRTSNSSKQPARESIGNITRLVSSSKVPWPSQWRSSCDLRVRCPKLANSQWLMCFMTLLHFTRRCRALHALAASDRSGGVLSRRRAGGCGGTWAWTREDACLGVLTAEHVLGFGWAICVELW